MVKLISAVVFIFLPWYMWAFFNWFNVQAGVQAPFTNVFPLVWVFISPFIVAAGLFVAYHEGRSYKRPEQSK